MSISLAVMIVLVCSTLYPWVERQVNTHYSGKGWSYWLFQLLLPFLEYFSLGISLFSFISLFGEIYLFSPWKRIAFMLGVVFALPSIMVILDSLLGLLAHNYTEPLTYLLFISTTRCKLVQSLLFHILPAMSGILLPIGLNRKSSIGTAPNANEFGKT